MFGKHIPAGYPKALEMYFSIGGVHASANGSSLAEQ